MSMMQKPVQQCRCQYIIAEQLASVAEILIAGQNDTAMLIALRNQPEEQFGLLPVQLSIAYLVNYQHCRTKIHPPTAIKASLQLGFRQILNQLQRVV